MSSLLERQNRIIISLLARSAIGEAGIEQIVRKGKKRKNADNFVKAYNALDGIRTATDIARIVGVSKQNMSDVLQTWEEHGIVYDVGTGTRPVYAGLMQLGIKRTRRTTKKKTPTKARRVPTDSKTGPHENQESTSGTASTEGTPQANHS